MGAVAIVMSGFPRRSETFALAELAALDARGRLAAIFATKPGDGRVPQPGAAPLVHRVCHLPAGSPQDQADAVASALAGRDVAAVHAYFAHAPAEVAWRAAARLGVAFGFSAHAKDARKAGRDALFRLGRAAACVVACNPDVHRDLAAAGTCARLVPHGVDLGRFRPRPDAPPASRRLLAVGRLVPKKGFDVLIDALAALDGDWRLDLVGDGPERAALEGRAAAAGVAGRITWHGGLGHDELPSMYRAASIVVVPSVVDAAGDRDGLPNVLLEAMASGCAVVGTDAGALSSALRHDETGVLVPAGQAGSLAGALGALDRDPGRVARLGRAARALVEQRFDVRRCAGVFADILEAAYA
ncbi:MAG: glycosyltransferase [Vicinamibacterales bacterium]